MIRTVHDNTYHFTSVFNDVTGQYIRGIDVQDDPFMAEYPHLIDVGVMGGCVHGRTGLCMKAGIKCYQNGLSQYEPNMTLENYKKIIDESKGRLFEIALGGRGDPDMHENFEEILDYSRENGVIPNFTTSGLGMTPEKAAICKRYCGAVAVSQYSRLTMDGGRIAAKERDSVGAPYTSVDEIPIKFSFANVFEPKKYGTTYTIDGVPYEKVSEWDINEYMASGKYDMIRVFNEAQAPNYTLKAIKMLMDAGVKTNIHYVLSNSTIDEALLRVKYNGFPKGINAVVFLLHKPVGLGDQSDVLSVSDSKVKEFFELVDTGKFPFKIGFDSCSIPGILKWSTHIDPVSIDTCEGSRFSMYISSDMKALPCSFDNQDNKFMVQLDENTSIKDAWDSETFEKFRSSLRNSCPNCKNRALCMGGCPLRNEIVLCNSSNREFKQT